MFPSMAFFEGLLLLSCSYRVIANDAGDHYNEPANQMTPLWSSGKTSDPMTMSSFYQVLLGLNGETGFLELKSDIEAGKASELSCFSCRYVIEFGKKFMRTEKVLRDVFYAVCSQLKIEKPRVCADLAELFSPKLFFIFKNSELTPKEMCGLLLGPACMSKADFFQSRINWQIEIPSVRATNPFSPREVQASPGVGGEAKDIKFLHLTDFHVDPYYTPGAPVDCGEPLCCRSTSQLQGYSTPAKINFDQFLPFTGDRDSGAGYWGTYPCDAPPYMVERLLLHINQSQDMSDLSYIMVTGDSSPHDVWNTTKESITSETRLLTDLIKTYLPGKVVVPVLGNHEGLPVNMFAPPDVKGSLSTSWLYEELYDQWKDWIPEEYADTFKRAGYFSRQMTPSLKWIAINSNLCARLNFWQLYDPNDPGDQLKWLAQELEVAESKSQSVHIVGHIAPDSLQCTATWLHEYMSIIKRYATTIKAQFFGHTHFDEVRIYYDDNQEPINVGFIGGSVTSFEHVNPAYKIFTIDAQATVADHHTYFFNLTEANLKNGEPTFSGYSARDTLGMKSQSALDWDAFYGELETNETAFDVYYSHYHRFSDSSHWPKSCRGSCRENILKLIKVFDTLE